MKKVNVTYALLYDKTKRKDLNGKNKGKNGSYYTLPGGAVKLGETLEEAVIREAKEENRSTYNCQWLSVTLAKLFFEERGHRCNFL